MDVEGGLPMNRPSVLKAIVGIALFISSSSVARAQAISVGGPAGADAAVWYDGSCYWAKDNGGRKIRVHLGPWSALLNPGQTFKFTGFGNCFSSYVGATTAEYAQ
jgi:hypothetical protein